MPLCVIDHAEERPILCDLRQQAQGSQADGQQGANGAQSASDALNQLSNSAAAADARQRAASQLESSRNALERALGRTQSRSGNNGNSGSNGRSSSSNQGSNSSQSGQSQQGGSQSQNGDQQDHSPKWNQSKHEAEADFHEHRIVSEMRSPANSEAHEVSDRNEQRSEH